MGQISDFLSSGEPPKSEGGGSERQGAGGRGSGPEVEVFARRLGSGPEVEVFAGGAGVRPRSRSFCFEKLYFGARPGGFALGADPVRGYLVMARMKVVIDMSIEVMVKKMLVEELKKALRA